MISVRIDFPFRLLVNPSRVVATAHKVFDSLQAGSKSDMVIYLCHKRTIHKLNIRYRKIDRPTDVLAFTYGKVINRHSDNYLGDVVIAVPVALKQARENHHSLIKEINLLVVHGILHLFGFDHESLKDRLKMWTMQETILRNL